MKITLDEVEGIIAMYHKYLGRLDFMQEDIDFIKRRLQYWDEVKKKLLEDQFLQIQGYTLQHSPLFFLERRTQC